MIDWNIANALQPIILADDLDCRYSGFTHFFLRAPSDGRWLIGDTRTHARRQHTHVRKAQRKDFFTTYESFYIYSRNAAPVRFDDVDAN